MNAADLRLLLAEDDDAFLEAHLAVMAPGADVVAALEGAASVFLIAADPEGLAVTFTGEHTARYTAVDALARVGDVARALGYEPVLHRDRSRTVLYLMRSEQRSRRAA